MRILAGLVVLALVMPASANLLSDYNASFERPAGGGVGGIGDWAGGATLDGNSFTLPAKLGMHYGSAQGGGGGSATYELYLVQTVGVSTNVVFSGYVAGGTYGGTGSLYVRLIDGSSSNDTVIAQWSMSISGGVYWQAFSLSGHSGTGKVKLLAGVHGGDWGSHAVHLDALNLAPEPASLALFGLAGLPFLRRRP